MGYQNAFKPVWQRCTNQYRHQWLDDGKQIDGFSSYCYTCKKCKKKRVKASSWAYMYYTEDEEFLGTTAPECIA